ncbi:hypothetical protein ABBQ32_001454 [Trebouxia sp. C0010 RCD-2024]
MGNGQSTSSGTKTLAKVARGDARAAQQVEDAKAGFFHTSKGRRAALAVAAERGNCQLLASVYEAAEQAKGSWQTRQDFLNAPGSKGQTLLMTSCCNGHLECVTYLLSKGADVMATNPKGETCLHIAAKNGHSSCVVRLLNSRINTPGAATRLADLVFAEGLEEVKYVDLHNLAGMTALHVAALNGSAATVQAVIASGASVDAQITGSNLTPWLSRGSTALHIAAARGFHAVVDVLLASHSPESGLDLRRMRNHRGLKPFQLARANGHSSIARQLCDTRPTRNRRDRRRRTAEGGSGGGGGGGGGAERSATTPEALLTMLIQRAKLLLTLKAMSTGAGKGAPTGINLLAVCTNGQQQEIRVEQAAAEVLECSEAWRKGGATAKPASSILRLLAALDELPAAAMLNAAYATDGGVDKGKSSSSYASAAMVQAALNAMASSASADPMESSSATLTPTTPLAAAVILQAALRSLTGGKKRNAGNHSRRSRQAQETPASSPRGGPRTSIDSYRAVPGGPVTPARAPAAAAEGVQSTSSDIGVSNETAVEYDPYRSRRPSPSPSLRKLKRQQQHQEQHQAGPSSPHSGGSTATTPRTPRPPPPTSADRPSAEFAIAESASRHAAATPARLPPGSIPATPEMAELGGETVSGGRATLVQDGRAAWQSPPSVQQQMLLQDALSSPARPERSPAPSGKLSTLPSAEDIDALCDMDKPSLPADIFPASGHSHVDRMYQSAHPALAPVLTHGSGGTHDDLADRPSRVGVPSSYPNEASTPQQSSSHSRHSLSRQHFPPNRSDMPESSARCCHSFRLQSECDSSAFDEGASSTLIHSISNEEQNMHDLLEDDNDDMFYNAMDSRQNDQEVGVDRHRTQQLNTMELHGILGEHGYKLPELAVDQEEEEEESDGDEGAGDEDLDDPDVDDDEDDEDAKAIFKTMPPGRSGEREEDEGLCSICMDRPLEAQISGCDHQICLQCAYQMCARGLTSPLCPFCRGPINTFLPV